MIRVVLVDDHPVVRSGYRRLLEQTGDIRVLREAGDADSGTEAFALEAPDVLVTDLAMPGGGLELIRRVLLRQRDARVLVFSMHDSGMLVRRALEAGARGFLTKSSPPDELVRAVRAVHGGARHVGPELAPALARRDPLAEAEKLANLTSREFEIFRQLAQGHSAAECAARLRLSPKTVSNHQTLIKEKLGVATSAALAHLAMRHGVITTVGA